MRMKPLYPLLYACAMAFLLLSCEHRPLEDPANAHYLRVYLDENLRNVTFGFYNEQYERPNYSSPRVVRAVLADPQTGKVVAERYLQRQGTDENGYYIDGYINAAPGRYNLLVYSYGAPYTMVRNENDYYTMQAYSNRASDYYHKYMPELMQRIDAGSIRQQPDHMFHEMMENIVVGKSQGVDTLRNAMGAEYGRFDDLMRACYHHEKFGSNFKGDNQEFIVHCPKMAFCASGTPSQFYKLCPSLENGAYSRYLIYMAEQETGFRSMAPDGEQMNRKTVFLNLSGKTLEMYRFLKEYPTEVKFTSDQW